MTRPDLRHACLLTSLSALPIVGFATATQFDNASHSPRWCHQDCAAETCTTPSHATRELTGRPPCTLRENPRPRCESDSCSISAKAQQPNQDEHQNEATCNAAPSATHSANRALTWIGDHHKWRTRRKDHDRPGSHREHTVHHSTERYDRPSASRWRRTCATKE